MSNYVVTTDFTAKDALAPGNPSKIIKGTEFGTEFTNIATAVGTKADANNPTLTGTITIGGVDLTSPLGYLNGVTSAIQTQFGAKAPLASYNGEKFLQKKIESLLKQTNKDCELIISDNASTDSTLTICQDHMY